MRRTALFAVVAFSLVSGNAFSQAYQLICSYAGGGMGYGLGNPAPIAVREVTDICNATGLSPVPVYMGNVPNASATVINGMIMIVYNPNFLDQLYRIGPAAPLSVLAHEVGHVADLDLSWYGSFKHPWTKELQADFFSGYALARLGVSLNDAQLAQKAVFTIWGSPSHPDSIRRLDAITAGWMKGSGN